MTTPIAPPAAPPQPREKINDRPGEQVAEHANGNTQTASASFPVQQAVAPFVLPIHRLSVAQYQQMIANGILDEDDAVELLDGWIVDKMPKSQNPTPKGGGLQLNPDGNKFPPPGSLP